MATTAASATSLADLVTTNSKPPSLCMKPLLSPSPASPNAMSPPVTLTSKEWIIPPRPKPGRKPATDTPPTKRKAQNRAAQRAFRERRAARVGELEEQLKEVEDQHEQDEDNLRSNIAELESTLERCRADMASWIKKCQQLEAELAEVRQKPASPSHHHHHHHHQHDTDTADEHELHLPSEPAAVGCGGCTLDTHCQCIDDVVKEMAVDGDIASQSRQPPSSSNTPTSKEVKVEPPDPDVMEIDFTTAFTKTPSATKHNHPSAGVVDPCGFCQDGTPCICAEMAAEQDSQNHPRPESPIQSNRSSQRQLAQFTPPPSEGDVANSIVPPPMGCASGPGTCGQCLADPNSTLFCKSLAASRRSGDALSGCCGGSNGAGGCCQTSIPLPPRTTRSRATVNSTIQLPAPNTRNSVTLTCADAYTALSRHSAYEQASVDMASWMPKLHANRAGVEGRPAMEIDAANVMAVLKDFDRRFGSNR